MSTDKIMAENNDPDSGQKGGATPPGTPARSGPATGAGAVKVGVYEQPTRPAQSPLMKWLPILIGLIALTFFAYRFLVARPATNANDTTSSSTPAAVNRDAGDTNRMSGGSARDGSTTNNNGSGAPASSGNGSATANPPGPAGAATRP